MKPIEHHALQMLIVGLAASAFSVSASAQDAAAPASVSSDPATTPALGANALAHIGRSRLEQVLFDEPGDGALWAAGASWKMSFDAGGATYYPRVGPKAPHNTPLHLSPARVTVGGQELAFAGSDAVTHTAERVEIDRGAFVEAYELDPRSLEQLFVFDHLPRAGELVLHIPVASELTGVATEDGLEFRSELGSVTYSKGTAVDARGRRAAIEPELQDGEIVLRVGAQFLAEAAWPVVIDPVVGSVFIDATTSDTYAPDVAWDPTQQGWLVVYEQVFSATDTDIYAEFVSSAGLTLINGSVDLTSIAWRRPRCADLAAATQFLVVAEVGPTATPIVRGRTLQPSGVLLVQGSQFTISNATAGNKSHPDVGGDPRLTGPTFYCVAYEHDFGAGDTGIAVRLVTSSSGLVNSAPLFFAHSAINQGERPSVSKSNDGNEWTIAWSADGQFSFGDIMAAHVRWDGVVNDGPFGVTAGSATQLDGEVSASSPLRGTRRSLLAFRRNVGFGGQADIWVTALDGATILQTINMTALENSGRQGVDQIEPCVDSNGEHFLVAYSEIDSFANTHYTTFATDLILSGDTVAIAESHQQLQNYGLSERRVRVTAQHSATTTGLVYLTMYDIEGNSTDHDVDGNLFASFHGGTSQITCSTPPACPCGNGGAPGNGCANSVFPSGAALRYLDGVISVGSDTARLRCDNLPSNVLCILLQGTQEDPAVTFGDGLRCTSGTLLRLGARNASGTSLTIPGPGEPSISDRGSVPTNGGMRSYIVWYRNAASFCTPSTFNGSNGMVLNWIR